MPACTQPGTERTLERRRERFEWRRREGSPAGPAARSRAPRGRRSPGVALALWVASGALAVGISSAAAQISSDFDQTGLASWYGGKFAGRPTASGETYNPAYLTGAHRSLPLGSLVRVHNLENDRNMVVRINDRGPFIRGRILDVSQAAAEVLGFKDQGVVRVRITPVQPPPAKAAATAPGATPQAGSNGTGEKGDSAAAPADSAAPADPAAFGLGKSEFTVESIPAQPVAGAAVRAGNPAAATPVEDAAPRSTATAAPDAAVPAVTAAAAPSAASAGAPSTVGGTRENATLSAEPTAAPSTAPIAPTADSHLPASPSTASFYVQIGAYRDPARAQERAASVQHLGLSIRTDDAAGLNRVLVGPFARRNQASLVQADLERSGISGFVRVLDPDESPPPLGSR